MNPGQVGLFPVSPGIAANLARNPESKRRARRTPTEKARFAGCGSAFELSHKFPQFIRLRRISLSANGQISRAAAKSICRGNFWEYSIIWRINHLTEIVVSA
jgi:hypothetical protein